MCNSGSAHSQTPARNKMPGAAAKHIKHYQITALQIHIHNSTISILEPNYPIPKIQINSVPKAQKFQTIPN